MNNSSSNWYLTLGIADVELDSEQSTYISKQELGFYVSLGQNLQDVLVLSNMRSGDPSSQPQSQVRFPLHNNNTENSEEKVVVVVKTIKKEQKVGSVSIPKELFMQYGDTKFR